MKHEDAIDLVRETMDFIANFDGEIPGATEKECGNYLDHSLKLAKLYAQKMSLVLKNWNTEDLKYNK